MKERKKITWHLIPLTGADKLSPKDLVNNSVRGLPAVSLNHGLEARADAVGIGLLGERKGLEDGPLGPEDLLVADGFQEASEELVCVLLLVSLELCALLAYL